jgi:endonuclease/exonuclease/phosphatase family metal-dependent hydrolase
MLVRYGQFELTSFYSGLPSTTPAVQSEVMFGIKSAVPAFSFLNRASGDVMTMYECGAAVTVNGWNEEKGEPLLTGGHSISNIYAAGAEIPRFCTQQFNTDTARQELNPLRLLLALSLYGFTALRILAVVLLESVVSVYDFIVGLFDRRNWRPEIKFIGARIAVCALLRELARVNVKLAIQGGSPIVYVNLLGYDEQAHRRGPDSRFAHWALKGIDGVIRDVYRSAQRSNARDYEVVVFSDHGQEAVRVYDVEYGCSIEDAAREAFAVGPMADHIVTDLPERSQSGNMDQRMRHMLRIRRGRRPHRKLTGEELADQIVVTAMGPIGHIYLPAAVDFEGLSTYAATLVEEHHVPLVLVKDDAGTLHAWNARGHFVIPEDLAQILGEGHTFHDQIATDIQVLCEQEDVGDLVILGWDPDQKPLSFADEGGGHGGIGTEETRGFALVPDKLEHAIERREGKEDYLRGQFLHRAALSFLRETRTSAESESSPDHGLERSSQPLRIMTYNIHGCVGIDGKLRPQRIAKVISASKADIVCLQEVDRNRPRSNRADQAAMIAEQLGFHHEFCSIVENDGEYGLAILSRFPLTTYRTDNFEQRPQDFKREPRGAMWAKIDSPAGMINVINTHLGLRRGERSRQVAQLLGDTWMGNVPAEEPLLICGDLNSGSKADVVQQLRVSLGSSTNDKRERLASFPSFMPVRCLDHILANEKLIRLREVGRIKTPAAMVASDHLPVVADIELLDQSTAQNKPTGSGLVASGAVRS